jgi:hypothetical protein
MLKKWTQIHAILLVKRQTIFSSLHKTKQLNAFPHISQYQIAHKYPQLLNRRTLSRIENLLQAIRGVARAFVSAEEKPVEVLNLTIYWLGCELGHRGSAPQTHDTGAYQNWHRRPSSLEQTVNPESMFVELKLHFALRLLN